MGGGAILHPQLTDHGEAVDTRQIRRDQNHSRSVRAHDAQSLSAIGRGNDLISGLCKSTAEHPLNGRIGIDD
jgi:hypothetical protein